MVGREYCVTMARYNAWQNDQLIESLITADEEELHANRGAFFGSIFLTLNHLSWGDMMWMSRFDGGAAPKVGGAESTATHPDFESWKTGRISMDRRILQWAEQLNDNDLSGDLVWYSGAVDRELSKSLALCITHFSNHQTHHRGQVHAMMTSMNLKAPVSDLVFMPQDK